MRGSIARSALACALTVGATLGSPALVAHATGFTSTVTSGLLNQGTPSGALSTLYGGQSVVTQPTGQGGTSQTGGIPGSVTSGLLNQGSGFGSLVGTLGSGGGTTVGTLGNSSPGSSVGTIVGPSGGGVASYPTVSSSGGVTTGRFNSTGTSGLFTNPAPLPLPQVGGSVPSQGTGQPAPTPPSSGAGSPQNQLQYVLGLVNTQRRQVDAQPLTLDAALTTLAQERAQAMAANNVISHDVPGYGYPDAMETAAGIQGKLIGGEDIATGLTVDEAFWNLVTSPWHDANLLFASYNTAGIGVATMPNGTVVLDLLFIER